MAINELEDILHGEEIEIPPSGGYRYHDRLGDSDFAVYMLQVSISCRLPMKQPYSDHCLCCTVDPLFVQKRNNGSGNYLIPIKY